MLGVPGHAPQDTARAFIAPGDVFLSAVEGKVGLNLQHLALVSASYRVEARVGQCRGPRPALAFVPGERGAGAVGARLSVFTLAAQRMWESPGLPHLAYWGVVTGGIWWDSFRRGSNRGEICVVVLSPGSAGPGRIRRYAYTADAYSDAYVSPGGAYAAIRRIRDRASLAAAPAMMLGEGWDAEVARVSVGCGVFLGC